MTAASHDRSIGVLIDNYRPFNARVTLYAAADVPLRPVMLADHRFGTGHPTMRVQEFDREDRRSLDELTKVLAADAGAAAVLGVSGRYVVRIEHRINDEGQFAAWGVSLGGVPRRVIGYAQPDRPHASRALISALPPK